MNNSREEIPQWCWYNGQFIFNFQESLQNKPNQSIQEYFNQFKNRNELDNIDFNLKNQGMVLMLLYGLLVIPREIWERTDTTYFQGISIHHFEFTIQPESTIDTSLFIRMMRNAISHANFEIDYQANSYKFWNINNNGQRTFEVKISHEGLGCFLTEIGKYYINEVKNRNV